MTYEYHQGMVEPEASEGCWKPGHLEENLAVEGVLAVEGAVFGIGMKGMNSC